MKSFKKLVAEVAQPKAGDEVHFKAKHEIEKVPHPRAGDETFKGGTKKAPKRLADHEAGEDAEVYEGLDPVNKKAVMGKFKHRADKDIDNDGDVDSSDKYLHARRKAVTKAIHKEDLDLSDFSVEEWEEFMESAEFDQLDEISKKTLGSYVKKASDDMANNAYTLGARDPLKPKGSWDKSFKRRAGIAKATDRLTKEETEGLDEISRDLARSYIRKVADKTNTGELSTKQVMKRKPGIELAGKKAYPGIAGKAKVSATESVEQLDELSPNTLHSYIKKAAGNMAGNAAVAAAQASSSMKKSSPDVKRKIKNRMQGITGASGRLADKANMAENWQEEIPMMMRQLEFIAYAAEEIMDYVEMAGDPEEWFQNKISGIHQSMLSMYAYAQGGRRAGYGFDESVEEELKGGQKKLDHNKNGKIDAHDFKLMRSKKMKEEAEQLDEVGDTPAGKKKLKNLIVNRTQKAVDAGASLERRPEKAAQYDKAQKRHMKTIGRAAERLAKEEAELDEAAPKIKPDFLKTQREKDRAHDAAMGRTPTGRKKTMTSTQRSMGAMRKEEIELDESSPTKKAITRALQGMKVQPKEKVTVKKAPWEKNEEVELDEVTRSAVKRTVNYVDAQGVTRSRLTSTRPVQRDQHGQEKIRESLEEAVKPGRLKLNDGATIAVSKQDADLVNQMFKDLNAKNRKKMQDTMMSDKAGFDEIVGFAREAL